MRRPLRYPRKSKMISWSDLFIPLGIVGLWVFLQMVVFPRIGLPT